MPTVMITGASRGLGLEFTRQYAADGWRVIATCRTPADAGALAGVKGTVEVHPLDVADHATIAALAETLDGQTIDLLLNNAGIYGTRPADLGTIDYPAWNEVMRVNVMGPLKVAEQFTEHVAQSGRKLMVAMSSRVGSIAANDSGGAYIYRSSKAALNAVMKSLSVDLAARGIAVVMFHPGWVTTDMGGAGAALDAPESVAAMIEAIAALDLEDGGRFINYDGTEVPW
ncbi:MAG: SDR family oxidoreductase [Rhodospirillales bacterium]|nr:SDR family oxidoreductase [Rhodospirillales bacterium]